MRRSWPSPLDLLASSTDTDSSSDGESAVHKRGRRTGGLISLWAQPLPPPPPAALPLWLTGIEPPAGPRRAPAGALASPAAAPALAPTRPEAIPSLGRGAPAALPPVPRQSHRCAVAGGAQEPFPELARCRALPACSQLAELGVAACALRLSVNSRLELQALASRAFATRVAVRNHTGRRSYPLPPADLTAGLLSEIFSEPVVALAAAYLGGEPTIGSVDAMWVPPGSPDQRRHRDLGTGPCRALVVAVSTSGRSVGTRVGLTSHASLARPKDIPEDAFVAPGGKGQALVFDAYAVHGGAANASGVPTFDRVFFTLLAPGLAPWEQEAVENEMFGGRTAAGVPLTPSVAGAAWPPVARAAGSPGR